MKSLRISLFAFFLIMLLFVCPVSADVQSDGYIVKVSDDAMTLFSARSSKVSALGGEYYKAESIEDAYEIFSEQNIEVIFPDYRFELFDTDYPEITSDPLMSMQWNLDLISAGAAREKGVFGKKIKMAVIDSGVNTAHSDFKKDNFLQGYNCQKGATDLTDISDNVGHGTNVCGIIAAQTDNQSYIAGIANEVCIIPLKVTDSKTFSMSNVYTAMEKAIELGCDVINMSLGSPLSNKDSINEFKSWIDKANDAGIIVVAAVGNNGETTLNYPAAFDNVIGVGSVDKNKVVSTHSQYNESVFVAAPGEDVYTLSKGGGYATNTGTSMATPHVAAAVALIKEIKPDCTLSEIKELLVNTSTDLGDNGYDNYYGHGLLNIEGILDSLQEYLPDVVVSQGMKNGVNRIHIHNNTGEAITADGYFTKHEDERLLDLNILHNIELNAGVTSNSFSNEYDCFMLLNNKLLPYTKKYIFEKDENYELRRY